jgi:formate dehydrogenase subunit gamma
MTTAVDRFDERARRAFGKFGRTVVYQGELLRHPVYTRFLHWSVAIFFLLSLASGLAIYTPWLFHWLTPLFGGGPRTRELHPWFSVIFVGFFALQLLNWIAPMTWTAADRQWLRRVKQYLTNEDRLEPEYVGFFNAGQKVYFWAIVGSSVLFLITGVIMWFPSAFGRIAVAVSYVLHDVAAILMLVGFIIHLYEGTAAQPGTFRSMMRGTVTNAWAWTHHPAWYREVTGRDPRADYERARRALDDQRRPPSG